MGDQPQEQARVDLAKAEARKLGYQLFIEPVRAIPRPTTHLALVAPVTGQATSMRPLAYGTSEAEAAEAGLAIVRRVAEHGEPWPERPS